MSPSKEAVIDIARFTGINLREDPGIIDDHELVSCVNFNVGRGGELIKRTGFEKMNTANLGVNSVKLLGYYTTATNTQILANIGGSLYYSINAISWTLIGTPGQYNVQYGVQYLDKFYMVRRGTTMLEWNGAAISAVAGSPGGDFCIIHKERIWILDSVGTGQPNYRIYFSNVLAPTDWGAGSGSIDINAGDGDFLVGAAIVHDLLVVFKSKSTWGIYVQGTSKTDWITRNLNKVIGCVSKYSIRVIEDLIYFVGATNVYRTDGTSFKSISDAILPVLSNRVVNLTNTNVDAAFFWGDIYLVMVMPTPGVYRYFAFNIRADGWTEWIMSGGIFPTSFLEIQAAVPGSGVYAGEIQPVGDVYRYGNNVFTDIGFSYDCIMQTKDFDLQSRADIKRGKWLALDAIGAASVTLTHHVNGTAQAPIGINTDAPSRTRKAVGPGFFRTWSLKMTVTTSVAFQFFGLSIYLHKKRSQIGASV